MKNDDLDEDRILRGARAIGAYLGVPASTVRRLDKQGALPTFTLPGETRLCARPKSLKASVAQFEADAVKARSVAA